MDFALTDEQRLLSATARSFVERLWRDARIERIWEGTSEIQRHMIARDALRPLEQG